jgi:hypothetical protein
MYENIQRDGADAAREGKSLLDCPFFKAAAMPHHTGEPIDQWHARVDAWEAGWRIASLVRTGLNFRPDLVRPKNRIGP